jgi:hypothetical protein
MGFYVPRIMDSNFYLTPEARSLEQAPTLRHEAREPHLSASNDNVTSQPDDEPVSVPGVRRKPLQARIDQDAGMMDLVPDLPIPKLKYIADVSDCFVPIDVPDGYPPLTFKPLTLRTWFLTLSILFFASCMAGVITTIYLYTCHPDSFHVRNKSYHLGFHFLPGAVGSIALTWFRTITISYGRLTPYVSMASTPAQLDKSGSDSWHRTLQSEGTLFFFTPSLRDMYRLWKHNHLLTLLMILVVNYAQVYFVPLKSGFLLFRSDNTGWTVVVSVAVGYVLVIFYFVFAGATAMILVRMWSRTTGLKWEVVSIASHLALIQGSNILEAFQGLDFANRTEMNRALKYRGAQFSGLRLGYWQSKNDRTCVWHGIRFLTSPGGE